MDGTRPGDGAENVGLGSAAPDDLSDAAVARLAWAMALFHLLVWVIVPALTQPNASFDAIEYLYWGREWQWGYYKHPPLTAWLAELGTQLFGNVIWPTFVLAQLCTLACFWSAYSVARACLGRRAGLLSMLLLEGSYYYNYTTTEFNNNVVSRAFFALTIACLYRGLVQGRLSGWIATGVTLGLGMLAKYDVGVLAVTMGLFSVLHPAGRAAWRTRGPYLALVISCLLFLPHVVWLFQNHFPTVTYFLQRSQSDRTWSDHLLQPLTFLLGQSGAVLPVCLLALPLLTQGWRLRPVSSDRDKLNRDFVLTFALGPVLLVCLLDIVAGVHLRSMWGTALWSFTGVALVVCLPIRQDALAIGRQVRLAATACLLTAAALAVHDVVLPALRSKPSRIHFPGRELALRVDAACRESLGTSPAIVGGPWWMAANVGFLLPGRATVYADMDPQCSPWTSDEALRDQGGVILWSSELEGSDWLAGVRRRFPDLVESPLIHVRTNSPFLHVPLEFHLAVIPPRNGLPQPVARIAGAPKRQ